MVLDIARDVLVDLTRAEREAARRRRTALEREIEQLEEKLFLTDEKLVEGHLSADSYQRLRMKYLADRGRAEFELESLALHDESLEEHLGFLVFLFSRLGVFYRAAPIEVKSSMLSSIFPEKLLYEHGKVRTLQPSPIIALFGRKSHKTKDAGAEFAPASRPVAGAGFEPATFGL